jgi:hypothetical protein
VCPAGTQIGWDSVGAFLVRDGCEIVIEPDPAATPERIRLFLLGAAMGVLLHQRGLMVLHASAVEMDGGVVAFLAPKWGGKSTMAAVLHSRGHPLVTDDILAIDLSGPTPVVHPGFPQLKLWPDTLALLGEDSSDVRRLHPQIEKRDYRAEARFPHRPLPLRAVFGLGPAERPSVDRLDAQAALEDIIGHWYCARFGYDTMERLGLSSLFLWSTDLVRRVPFYRLGCPRSLSTMWEVAAAVEESVGAGDSGPISEQR